VYHFALRSHHLPLPRQRDESLRHLVAALVVERADRVIEDDAGLRRISPDLGEETRHPERSLLSFEELLRNSSATQRAAPRAVDYARGRVRAAIAAARHTRARTA
jgi:hypothetical protein